MENVIVCKAIAIVSIDGIIFVRSETLGSESSIIVLHILLGMSRNYPFYTKLD